MARSSRGNGEHACGDESDIGGEDRIGDSQPGTKAHNERDWEQPGR